MDGPLEGGRAGSRSPGYRQAAYRGGSSPPGATRHKWPFGCDTDRPARNGWPASAAAPTLDPEHDLLYVGTGNSYTDVPAPYTDSILALRMSTGALAWANQLRPKDNYIVGCDAPAAAGQGNCPKVLGPDVDFGTSPILRTLATGERVLLTGEKSGRVGLIRGGQYGTVEAGFLPRLGAR